LPYRIDIRKGKGFVHTTLYGLGTPSVAQQLIKESIEKADEWGFSRFLIDFRNAQHTIDAFEEYIIANKKARSWGVRNGSKHVLLINPDIEIERWRFMETLYRNAGFIIELFTDEELALASIQK